MKLKAEIRPSKRKSETRLIVKSEGNNKTIVHSESYKNKNYTKKVAKELGFKNPVDKSKKKKRG